MMIKVTRQFKDKNTKELYNIGRELDLPVARVNEIIKVGGLIEIQDVQGEEAEPIEPEKEESDSDSETASQRERPDQETDQAVLEETKAAGRRKRSK